VEGGGRAGQSREGGVAGAQSDLVEPVPDPVPAQEELGEDGEVAPALLGDPFDPGEVRLDLSPDRGELRQQEPDPSRNGAAPRGDR
jgi:hypothetical protein